jgi:LysM repeat protein
VTTPSPVPPVTYTVVAGDSLVEIADRFGVTVDALLAANDIDDPEQLRIGQVLVIP